MSAALSNFNIAVFRKPVNQSIAHVNSAASPTGHIPP
jgi:hypothetical protein